MRSTRGTIDKQYLIWILLQQNLYNCQDLPSAFIFLISDRLAFQKGDNLKTVLFPEVCWFLVIESKVSVSPSQLRTFFVFFLSARTSVIFNKDILAKPSVNFVSQQFPQTHGVWSKSFIIYLVALSGQARLICKSLSNIMIQFSFLSMVLEHPRISWMSVADLLVMFCICRNMKYYYRYLYDGMEMELLADHFLSASQRFSQSPATTRDCLFVVSKCWEHVSNFWHCICHTNRLIYINIYICVLKWY